MNGDAIPVLFTRELLERFVCRDDDGNRLVLEIGEPDSDGYYTPTVGVDVDDNPFRGRFAQLVCLTLREGWLWHCSTHDKHGTASEREEARRLSAVHAVHYDRDSCSTRIWYRSGGDVA